MTSIHKEKLRQNHLELTENMDCQMVTQYLRSKFILTAYDADRIGKKDLQTEAGRLLLDILYKKSDAAFMHLVDALNSKIVNQSYLADLLRPSKYRTLEQYFKDPGSSPSGDACFSH